MKIANCGSARFLLFKIDENDINVANGVKDKFSIFRANLFSIQLQHWNQFNTQYSMFVDQYELDTILHLANNVAFVWRFSRIDQIFFFHSKHRRIEVSTMSHQHICAFLAVQRSLNYATPHTNKKPTKTTSTNSFVIIWENCLPNTLCVLCCRVFNDLDHHHQHHHTELLIGLGKRHLHSKLGIRNINKMRCQ